MIALTHDPKLDDMALMEALCSEAFYVSAIGSRVNNQKRRERLTEHFDMTQQLKNCMGRLAFISAARHRLKLPSILAELTAVKNGVALPRAVSIADAKTQAGLQPTGATCDLSAQ